MLHKLLFILVVSTSAFGCELKPVQNLVATEVKSLEIQVGWSAPTAEDLACSRGYRVCWTPDNSSVECDSVHNTSVNQYLITSLQSCSHYYLTVVTVGENNATSGPASLLESTAPSQVTGLGVVRKNNDTILAIWSYSPAGTQCAAQFELSLCGARQTNCNVTLVAYSGWRYSHALQRKRNCDAYFIDIVALDNKQQRSDNFRFTGLPDAMGVPENLTVTNCTSSSFAMDWAIPPAQANCDYLIRVDVHSIVGFVGHSYTTLYNGGVTNHLVENVTSCTAYNVTVGFGTAENVNSASTKAYTLPEGDKIFNNASVRERTSSSVTVAWATSQPNSQCIAAYSVCWRRRGAADVACRNSTNDKTNLQIAGLAALTNYHVSVAALLQTGGQFDVVTVEAATKSVAANLVRNYLVGISALFYTFRLTI